jgi:transposase
MIPDMKAYSKDLRLKVLDAIDRGMDRGEVARVFGVCLASMKRWLKMRREQGDVEPPHPRPSGQEGGDAIGVAALPARAQPRPHPR